MSVLGPVGAAVMVTHSIGSLIPIEAAVNESSLITIRIVARPSLWLSGMLVYMKFSGE